MLSSWKKYQKLSAWLCFKQAFLCVKNNDSNLILDFYEDFSHVSNLVSTVLGFNHGYHFILNSIKNCYSFENQPGYRKGLSFVSFSITSKWSHRNRTLFKRWQFFLCVLKLICLKYYIFVSRSYNYRIVDRSTLLCWLSPVLWNLKQLHSGIQIILVHYFPFKYHLLLSLGWNISM